MTTKSHGYISSLIYFAKVGSNSFNGPMECTTWNNGLGSRNKIENLKSVFVACRRKIIS